jgi:hypothetical protein
MRPRDVWIPLVDEPIGSIVESAGGASEIDELVSSPRGSSRSGRSPIRVGVLLGQLLVENDVPAYDGTETWVEALLRDERHEQAVVRELRAVAEEVAADPRYADDGQMGPDDAARERFREFARKQLG